MHTHTHLHTLVDACSCTQTRRAEPICRTSPGKTHADRLRSPPPPPSSFQVSVTVKETGPTSQLVVAYNPSKQLAQQAKGQLMLHWWVFCFCVHSFTLKGPHWLKQAAR